MFPYAFLVILAGLFPQLSSPASRPPKVLTPEQRSYQASLKVYQVESDRIRHTANAAFGAETAREKVPSCPDAQSTRAENECLSQESDRTQTNYKVFFTALQAILALPDPRVDSTSKPFVGVTGPEATPATNTAALKKSEAVWQTYADAECTAVDTKWRGGTIVNAMYLECTLRLARARLHELDAAYDFELHPH